MELDLHKKGTGVHKNGSPYSDKECEEIIRKLGEMLDGELDNQKDPEFIQMVESCEYCLEQYEMERSFRNLIKLKIAGFNSRVKENTLISSIKERLLKLK